MGGDFNADVIINIPPAFFSLQKSGLVRVYLTSVFLLLSVPRCFGDQKPQFDFFKYKHQAGIEMSNEGESTEVLDLLREMREEIRLEKSKREEREREWEEEKERGREREKEWKEQVRKRDEELESWREIMKEVKEEKEMRKNGRAGGGFISSRESSEEESEETEMEGKDEEVSLDEEAEKRADFWKFVEEKREEERREKEKEDEEERERKKENAEREELERKREREEAAEKREREEREKKREEQERGEREKKRQKEEEEKKNLHRTPLLNVAQQRGYRGFETPGLSGIESRRSPDEFRPTNLPFASSSRQALLLPRQEPSMLSQDISQVISCNIMSKLMEKAKGKKLYLGMPVASFLEWLQYLAERAQGDSQVLRAALLAKSSGEAAQFVREKLASLPVGGDPVAAAIEGVYGRDWKGVLWKEYREARGTDARSLWAGLCRIGRVLGKPEEDWRRTFVQALPERVSSQLLMVCRSEERLLSDPNWGDIVYSADVAWRGMKQEEGERKNMSGASGGGLSAPKAKPPKQPAQQCALCQLRAHDQSLCVLNPKGRNFKEGVRCQLCGLDGHAASGCNEYIQRVAEKKNKSFLPQYIIHLAEFQSREVGEEDERVWLPLTVRSVRAEVLYDTGASRSHCDEKWAVDHGVKWKKKEGLAATQSGLEVKVKGEAWVKFTYGAAQYKQKWVVLQGERGFAAISERDGRDLGVYVKGVVPVHSGEGSNPVDDREWLEEGNERSEEEEMLSEEELEIVSKITKEALEKNAALPDSAVCNDRDMVHRFDIPDGSVVYRAAYKQTKEVRKKIHKRIMEWVEKGFCKPAKGGNMNNLPLLLVDKVSGGVVDPDDYQVCIDARPLNAKNRSKKFVLPKIADVIEKAKKATMMADLDLQNAFHQILLDEFSSNLSAFTDPFTGKRYQMTNMWFGESGSVTQMQKVVQAALGMGEPGTEDWRVDNMLVLYEGDKVEEFAHQVRRLVEKLTEKGLKLKPAKCKVGYKKMRILGHLCEKGAASIDPEKVKCFSKMERPKSLQALRSVLGFLNYVSDYVPIVANLLGPLRELAKKRKWREECWDERMDKNFQTVKEVLESAPVLSSPDFAEPFVMATDASQYGVGAVLYQKIGGRVKFIAFGVKALKRGQKNYPSSKRELLALLFGLRRWGEFLKPQSFEIEADNRALVHLRSEKSFMARDWLNYVADYDFRVTHCPGVSHILPHHLSHLYGILPGGEREEREMKFEEEREERVSRKKREKGKEKEEVEEGEGSDTEEGGRIQLAEISEEQERASRDSSSEGERKGKQEERRVDLAEMETRSKKRTEVSLEKGKKRERREGEEQEGGERGESSSGGARKREDQERRSRGEVECEERSAEERERGVQELKVRDVPAEGLREKEAEFRDLVMEAKGVEKEGERRKLVEESHQEAHEGGYHLFMKLLRKGVFWKEMKKECREEVKKCVQCLRFNVGKRGFFPLRARGVMYPMQQVHVDHLGTLEVAEGKFQHVLVVVDAATRFVWLEPVESCSGREMKEKLEKIFRVVGWPGTLVSDGGSVFVNEEIERMLVEEGVERQVATPGAHEHNALVERWIREVRAVMNKKLELKRDGWASELARIQEALNNRYVVPLKSTPFDLFFARNPDMRKKSRGEAEGDEERVDGESNAGKLRRRNEAVVEEVYLKIAEGAKRVRQEGCDRKSEKRRRAKKFGVGELVMVRVDRKSKQDPFYEGVFEVVKFVKEKAEYQLARMGEKEVRVRTRHENLKRASGSEVKGEGRYEVTRVEDMREEQGVRKYLVKWKGHRERT